MSEIVIESYIGKSKPDEDTRKSLKAIVEQLEKSNYRCEGSILNNNVAFIALKRLSNERL